MQKFLALLVLVAAVAFAASPAFVTRFDGFDPMQFPVPQDNPPAQPAGWAFSIWGVIYLWLIAGSLFGLLRRSDDPDWAPMRLPLLLSLGPGVMWLQVAVWSPVWAAVLIWWMLGTAVWALMRAGKIDPWLQKAPVALYAGWLTAASSVSLALLAAGWGVTSGTVAAVGALIVAIVVAVAVQSNRPGAPLYGVAVIWALSGIVAANLPTQNWLVAGLAGLGIAIMAGLLLRNRMARA